MAQLPTKKCKGKERPFCCFYLNGWGPPGKLKRSVGFKCLHALAHALAEWEAKGGPEIKYRIKMDQAVLTESKIALCLQVVGWCVD